ncbi:HIRA-interacting protein 3-like isoform X2 [Pogonomyrmex barbatus]|nr:HIRA-interacting protein 3-like isoform X2 [Pogonomyrmex barbatus]
MDRLQLSSDSIDTAVSKKRSRIEDSENEGDLPAKKRQSFFQSERSKVLKQDNPILQSSEEINIKEIIKNEDNSFQKPAIDINLTSASKDEKMKDYEIVKSDINQTIEEKENKRDDEKGHIIKRDIMDTEVVGGLELSVECASDKEEQSSESENERDAKPRPKTIIVKAEPNESELDCSSSENEKSDVQRVTDISEIKSENNRTKKRGSRTSFSKLKPSGSDDSQNNNSDEDYSPRTKKKIKRSSLTRRSTNKHRSVESKRGRTRGKRKNSRQKSIESIPDDEDACAVVTERTNGTLEAENEMEKELSDKSSSIKSESDNKSEEEKFAKDKKRRRNNVSRGDKVIQMLKKYLKVAGVKVKSYSEIWADCKSNAAKIKRLKELLEKNGINGRPTLEKCKRIREQNEKMREVSELDVSNIISEGRVCTRARRNMENVKKTIPSDTSHDTRHREIHNTFRRIQTVVDSDSE